ncbi:hypothetical protein VTO73DRAFT_9181 [Trametes versicolor]
MASYLERLALLSGHLGEEAYEDHQVFLELLKSITSIVREAEDAGAPDLSQIIERVAEIFDDAVYWAYSGYSDHFDFLPSFAHSLKIPLIKDTLVIKTLGGGEMSMEALAAWDKVKHIIDRHQPPNLAFDAAIDAQRPRPWPETPHPHPKTTRLSLFRKDITPSSTDATPLARTIYQARCEVAADTVACPVSAAIATDASILALIGGSETITQGSNLTIYFLDEQTGVNENGKGAERIVSSGGFRYMVLDPRLSEAAHDVAVDTAHKLALIADRHRIKSFSSGGNSAFDGWTPARGDNVHTMNSGKYDGPLAVLPDGRIARAGKGGVAIWDFNTLETHQGGGRVGTGTLKVDVSWRDDGGSGIERSIGSAPSATITFTQAKLTPAIWHHHAPTGHMLCAESSFNGSKSGCYALDLEGGGKTAARFLGHGANVKAFSTSAGDANVFLTACADGYARLYDVRHPLPAMTLDSGGSSEICEAAVFVHPDGIPTVFTGGHRRHNIKTWDIRARALVYELSTGNNAVHTLTWDDHRAMLYAGTECFNMDRHGNTHGYRAAHIPRWAQLRPEERIGRDEDEDRNGDGHKGMGEDDDDYDSAEETDDEHCWPKEALHNEKTFGYAYDAGEHVLLRYRFKEDADPNVLPAYGQASTGRW